MFVQYANEMLMRPEQSKWCVSGRTRSKSGLYPHLTLIVDHQRKLGEPEYCVPAPKTLFYKLCTSHHIAIDVSESHTKIILQENVFSPNVKYRSLREIPRDKNKFMENSCFVSTLRSASTQAHETANWNLKLEAEEFVIGVGIDEYKWTYCMLELFNYLDIYFNLQFVQHIYNIVVSE
jgi:hypothetical protein